MRYLLISILGPIDTKSSCHKIAISKLWTLGGNYLGFFVFNLFLRMIRRFDWDFVDMVYINPSNADIGRV